MIKSEQYFILKINVGDIISSGYNLVYSKEQEEKCLIAESESSLIYQIEKIRGRKESFVKEIICVLAKHNKKKWPEYDTLFRNGFCYNGVHYSRLGKSASQSKEGVTVFVDSRIYDQIMDISLLGMKVEGTKLVIPKFESQRCLIFSNCYLLKNLKIPYIVIVDEYTKILPAQDVKYAKEVKKENEDGTQYSVREILDGIVDVKLSPFDGCGVHDKSLGVAAMEAIGLDYRSIGLQIRLPYMKGYSVEFDFKKFYKEQGIDYIKDVLGHKHKVDDIDCIWNTSMFKAYGMFKERYGDYAIEAYFDKVNEYGFKLGISKYSHHISKINLKARLNFQYLQCLALENPRYIEHFNMLKEDRNHKYDIMDESNDGPIISVAKYSTSFFEKVCGGDKAYALKFLGFNSSEKDEVTSNYIKAILINEDMLKDPSVKRMLKRKAQRFINQMKIGKIYCDGFYHTAVGDIIGYLEYVAEKDVKGVLGAGEFYVNTIFEHGEDLLSFRSPLVCPSEVNKVVVNKKIKYAEYFEHFKGQDVFMLNMYDLTMPQQGGMEYLSSHMETCG